MLCHVLISGTPRVALHQAWLQKSVIIFRTTKTEDHNRNSSWKRSDLAQVFSDWSDSWRLADGHRPICFQHINTLLMLHFGNFLWIKLPWLFVKLPAEVTSMNQNQNQESDSKHVLLAQGKIIIIMVIQLSRTSSCCYGEGQTTPDDVTKKHIRKKLSRRKCYLQTENSIFCV